MPAISTRIQQLPASAIRKYLPKADELRQRGVEVYPLNIGQPDVEIDPAFYAAIREIHPKVLAYAPSAGEGELRQAICDYYDRLGVPVRVEDVIATMGASEALMAIFDVVCDAGDEVIVFEPFYTNYQSMAGLKGVMIKAVSTNIENGFALPAIDVIAQAINQKTRAILLCNPNNPTGAVIPRETLEALVKLAIEKDIFLVVDEVYREFVFQGSRATSILEIDGSDEVAILVDSVSKRYSACGARVGWLVSRRADVMAAALKYMQMRLSAPTLDQLAMARVMRVGDEDIQRAKQEYALRREVAYRILQSSGIKCSFPAGALYMMVDTGVDADLFTQFMLQSYSGIERDQETVLMTPASGFYLTSGAGQTQLRMAFVIEERALERALHHFVEGLREFTSVNGSLS